MIRATTLYDTPLRAVNGNASSVIGSGFKYEPSRKIQTADQPFPFKTKPVSKSMRCQPEFKDRTGERVGRLSVYGMADVTPARWACRCDCGTHTLRTTKAVGNPSNSDDRCEQCRHLQQLQRGSTYRQTGRDPEVRA